MSDKKKKKNVKKTVKEIKNYTVVGIIFAVLLVVLLLYLVISNFSSYYKVESRVDKVDSAKKYKDTTYKTIGWLRVQGTDIDLPILHSQEVDEKFPVELESFVWSDNIEKGFHNYMKIQGHNIFNLSAIPKKSDESFHRFEELMAFVYYDFAKDNKYIQLTVDGKDYVYKIFSVGFVDKATETFFPIDDDVDKEKMKEQIKLFKNFSFYDYDVDVKETDKIITLSTCTRFYGVNNDYGFYVVGRLLREGEKINNYKVKKNKSYNEIEEKLKGDEKNEEDNA